MDVKQETIVLGGAEIGEYTLLGAGSLAPPGKTIPSGVLAMGSPAKVIRDLTEDEKKNLIQSALKYVETANNHRQMQKGQYKYIVLY